MSSGTPAFSPFRRELGGADWLGIERTRSVDGRHVNENLLIRQGHLWRGSSVPKGGVGLVDEPGAETLVELDHGKRTTPSSLPGSIELN